VEIQINNLQNDVSIDKKKVRELIRRIVRLLRMRGRKELSFAFVDAQTIAQLNREYRGSDDVTDVLSFLFSSDNTEKDRESKVISGEIVICPSVARDNCERFGTSLEEELALLLTHGLLHQLGYEDGKEEERKAMSTKQDHILVVLKSQGRIEI
jgi:probable rRNA maturation factor